VDQESGEEVELICAVGDFVHLVNPDDDAHPFIARIADLWEDRRSGKKHLTARWFYRGMDLPKRCKLGRKAFGKNEVFLSDHYDVNSVESILETIRIEIVRNHNASTGSKPSQRSVTSLIMDGVDQRYGWGDELLSSEEEGGDDENDPPKSRVHIDYQCSRKLDIHKNLVFDLPPVDCDRLVQILYSKRTKAMVKKFVPEAVLADLRLRQLAEVVLNDMNSSPRDVTDDKSNANSPEEQFDLNNSGVKRLRAVENDTDSADSSGSVYLDVNSELTSEAENKPKSSTAHRLETEDEKERAMLPAKYRAAVMETSDHVDVEEARGRSCTIQ